MRVFVQGLLLLSRNFANSINYANGHEIVDISNNRRFSVWKIAKGNWLLTLDICVGELLGVGKLLKRKTRIFHSLHLSITRGL